MIIAQSVSQSSRQEQTGKGPCGRVSHVVTPSLDADALLSRAIRVVTRDVAISACRPRRRCRSHRQQAVARSEAAEKRHLVLPTRTSSSVESVPFPGSPASGTGNPLESDFPLAPPSATASFSLPTPAKPILWRCAQLLASTEAALNRNRRPLADCMEMFS